MINIHWIYLLVWLVLTLPAIVAVLMDNKQPAKAIAWILLLIFVPYAGLVLYFFFGQNVRRQRLISKRSMDQLTKRSMLEFAEQENLHLPEDGQPLMRLFTNQNWALPFKDNHVDVFTSGSDFFLSLLQAIGSARHHIHLDTYIIEDDALGRLIADALIDKARLGVEVRLVYDDVGCWRVKDAFFERLRDAGVEVHAFMPVRFPAFTRKVNYRNHRKLCVVDGKVAFIGGMNIALRYVRGDNGRAWRDTHLRIEGGGVYAVQRAFLVDWYFVDRTLITDRCYYPPIAEGISNDCLPWATCMSRTVRRNIPWRAPSPSRASCPSTSRAADAPPDRMLPCPGSA